MTDVDAIRNRYSTMVLNREGFPKGLLAYHYVNTLLAEIDTLRAQLAQLSEESQTIPVAVDNDPPELVQCGSELVPAKHFEFYTHTRKATSWHSPDCPACADEPGAHDREHREINDLTLTLWHGWGAKPDPQGDVE